MRILFGRNTPMPLRYALRGHQGETAYEKDWSELSNGDLVAKAEAEGFDLLLVLSTNDWTRIRYCKTEIRAAVDSMKIAEYLEFEVANR